MVPSTSKDLYSQRATDQNCRKSVADLLPGKSAAFSKAAADFASPCGGLQPTCRARGGVTRARGAALQGPSAPNFHGPCAGRVSGTSAARMRRCLCTSATNRRTGRRVSLTEVSTSRCVPRAPILCAPVPVATRAEHGRRCCAGVPRWGLRVVYLEYILVVTTTVHPYG